MLPLVLAILAASTTMVGWAMVAARRHWPQRTIGWLVVGAGAAMCLVSAGELLPTAVTSGLAPVTAGAWFAVGVALVAGGRALAARIGGDTNRLNRSAGMIAVAIAVHNIPEGAATVSAALLSPQAGLVTAVAVAIHNIPEGIAVTAPVVAAGGSRRRSFVGALIVTGGEVLGAVFAAVFGQVLAPEAFAPMLAIVAGVMISLSVWELFPWGVRLARTASADGQQRAPEHQDADDDVDRADHPRTSTGLERD